MNENVIDLVDSLKETLSDLLYKSKKIDDSINNIDCMINDSENLIKILKRNKSILKKIKGSVNNG